MGEIVSFNLQKARAATKRWEESMWGTIQQLETLAADSTVERNALAIRMLMGSRWMLTRSFDQPEATSDDHRLIGYSVFSNLNLVKDGFHYAIYDERYLDWLDLVRLPFLEYEVLEYVPTLSDVTGDPNVVTGVFAHNPTLVCQSVDVWKQHAIDYCAEHDLFVEPILIAYGAYSQIPQAALVSFDTSDWCGASGVVVLSVQGNHGHYKLIVRLRHDIWQKNCELAEAQFKNVEDS